jgi:guanylate kinase
VNETKSDRRFRKSYTLSASSLVRSVIAARPVVFVGPSGIGKNTIIGQIMNLYPDRFAFSVSHTTRAPREGEVNDVNDHFVSREEFERDLTQDKFLEHALVHGNYYRPPLKQSTLSNIPERFVSSV